MVRYPKDRKEQTRRRIVEAASRAYREQGVSGVGIGELMQSVGLTHGGFYAHFPSKDALVAEACDRGVSELSSRLFAEAEERGGADGLRLLIRGYVSRLHRDDPGVGCTMPSLAADVSRAAPEVRAGFTRTLRRFLARVAELLPSRAEEAPAEEPPDEALVLASGMVGAVLLARAVDDPELSDRILLAARRFYTGAFAEGAGRAPE
ncbi:MAG TPA: TetR/AcrR family transcriptional regulator [Longimicrobiaceae bacterium]|nr:TetR/AcrR family transcriptional regulator [Longimicrobiaceae bacterium]